MITFESPLPLLKPEPFMRQLGKTSLSLKLPKEILKELKLSESVKRILGCYCILLKINPLKFFVHQHSLRDPVSTFYHMKFQFWKVNFIFKKHFKMRFLTWLLKLPWFGQSGSENAWIFCINGKSQRNHKILVFVLDFWHRFHNFTAMVYYWNQCAQRSNAPSFLNALE
jgi:hypothetical protein